MPYGGNQRQPFGLCLGEQHAIEISQMLVALTNTRLAHGYPAADASFIS
ncbi:hypothetical protein M495_04445 [Serratia liquefaciens ATCC 27592]|nr:hypothetical protein M495_04445 [Serratia liquefaciens ATCC 27592]